jgi:hypothetical protein
MTTLKTIKLKRAPSAEPMQASPTPIATAETSPSAPSVPPPPPGLEPVSSKPKASSKSYTAFAILAIVATLFCLAIIGMQYTELSFYKADPSVWSAK